MKKILLSSLVFINMSMGASFDDISIGDTYYINNFGDNNDFVIVVEKRNDGTIKVKDGYGTPKIVYPSKLLTKSELDEEEFGNKVLGWGLALGIIGCYANGDCGN